MHDRCEWSIINGLGNGLWMCNIICNRQLNMDRENIATIAPQMVKCSTRMSRIIVKHRLLTFVWKCRGSVGGGRNENPTFVLETIIVHLEKNVKLIIWVNKQNMFLFHPPPPPFYISLHISGLQTVGSLKTQTMVSHTRSLNVCLFLRTSKTSLSTTHTVDLLLTLSEVDPCSL